MNTLNLSNIKSVTVPLVAITTFVGLVWWASGFVARVDAIEQKADKTASRQEVFEQKFNEALIRWERIDTNVQNIKDELKKL